MIIKKIIDVAGGSLSGKIKLITLLVPHHPI